MNVKQLREERNLSQQDLADKTGIPKDRIAKWEQGKGSPKASDSDVLLKFFGNKVPQTKEELVPHETSSGDDYLSGENLSRFSEAHRDLVKMNYELVMTIVRVHSGTSSSPQFAADLQGLIEEIGSGKKQMSMADVQKRLNKVLVLHTSGR